MTDRKISAFTLGCKVNQYETEAVLELFRNCGYRIVDFNQEADVCLINTCSVTAASEQKNRQIIRRAIRLNPDAVIAVMGCYSQISPEQIKALESVDIIIGTSQRTQLPELVEQYFTQKEPCNLVTKTIFQHSPYEKLSICEMEGHTRAFVKIQDGCSQFCSYCIIPYTRGGIRSRGMDAVLNEITHLRDNGYKEVVLVGIHLSSYGQNPEEGKPASLSELIHKIGELDGISRIRLGSLEPLNITEDLLNRLQSESKFCPHFHLALQSGSDSVLKRMNRHYTREDFLNIVESIRVKFPNAAITTDIMVGFPGETKEEFEESYQFAKHMHFSKMHVFPYSQRKGTAAAAMPDQVSAKTKKERAEQMGQLAASLEKAFLTDMIGTTVPVLIEAEEIEKKENELLLGGYTDHYARVLVKADPSLIGKILPLKILYAADDCCIGEYE